MRTGGVSSAALLLVLTSSMLQVSSSGDIYWEGEEDASNEFLEVKNDDSLVMNNLKRFKRFDPFGWFDSKDSVTEAVTESIDDSASYGKDDDSDSFGSGSPDKTETEPREKTLRVTFLVMEPCPAPLTRDSPAVINISRSLENAVDALYESLPGTQRSSLVRVQNLETDDFLCKITLDIVTTGYEDTDKIKDILRNTIKNNGRLGETSVRDGDFSAQLIDPGATLHCNDGEFKCDENVCLRMSVKCDGRRDCSDGTDESNCPTTSTTSTLLPEEQRNSLDYDIDEPIDQNPEGIYGTSPDGSEPITPSSPDTYDQTIDSDSRPPEQTDDRFPFAASVSPSSSWGIGSWGQRGDLGEENETGPTDASAEESETPLTPDPRDITTRRVYTIDTDVCPPDHMRCDETRCVENSKRCDSRSDCDDGADEAGCPGTCGADDFRCNNGKCIESSRRCDNINDCQDQEDERDCECRIDEFRCHSDGSCIESRKRCDNEMQCADGSDEIDCDHVCRDTGQFRCGDGKCISILLRCDGFKDCKVDGSDEMGCPCRTDQWQCDHGTCIKRSQRCDGRVDCPTDRSDERNCIATGYFRCRSGMAIPESLRCNRKYDCLPGDFSDEQNCPCGASDFKCNNGHCIPANKHCDRTHDCQDGSDERNCTYGTLCMAYEYECTSGMCVRADARCNGTVECDDSSDETSCPCKREQYPCRDGSCINIKYLCNGRDDCSQGEDEYHCGTHGNDSWKYNDGNNVSVRRRCDGHNDSADHSDEKHCEPSNVIKGATSCPPERFTCNPGSRITCAEKCDGVSECDDGEDEEDCRGACAHKCDGSCISPNKICDRNRDCSDGSDEEECDYCDSPDDFRCNSGDCVPITLRCNGIEECSDSSDESNCNTTIVTDPEQPCTFEQFQCISNHLCIDHNFACDGHTDCIDGSDEDNCPWYMTRASRSPVMAACLDSEFTCYDGRCIPHTRRCDNIYDCFDFSDEQNCYNSGCPKDSWQCRSGECHPSTKFCDGIVDCQDGTDEIDCPPFTTSRIPVTTEEYPRYPERYPPGYPDGGSSGGDRYPDGDSSGGRYPDSSGGRYPDSSGGRYPDSSGGRYPDSSGGRYPDSSGGRYPDSSGGRYPDSSGGRYPGEGNSGDRYPGGDSNGGRYPDGDSGVDRYPDSSSSGGRYPDGNSASERYPDSASNGGRYPDSGSTAGRYPGGDNGGGRYPDGGTSGGRYPDGDSGGNRYPDAGSSGSDRYPDGESSGSRYPDSGSSGGDRYPDSGPSGGDRYPDSGSSAGGRYPDSGSSAGGRYPDSGSSTGGSYPNSGSSASGRYPDSGSSAGGSYPESGSSAGGRYPDSGSSAGGRYPDSGSSAGGRYPDSGSNSGGYPDSNGLCGLHHRWPCENGGCISHSNRCDGRIDCPFDHSDEFDCPYHRKGLCSERYSWPCENGGCISLSCRCDGHIDCPLDFSDEWECPHNSPPALKLKTYPPEQSVRNGGDVVFQCRDEGPLRAAVTWHREGRPLKAGSTDVRGRLEMFKVTEIDSGIYFCQADSYLNYPGSKVRVNLRVETAPVTSRPPFPACQPYEATCGNGQCIPKSAVCDNNYDCSDRSDEENCHHNGMCEPNQFKCNNGKCVLKTWICDSENDCGDNSDEQNCGYKADGRCSPVEHTCKSGDQCIPKSFHCDGQTDCMDGSDEIGCSPVHVTRPPKPSNVKLSPGETLTLKCEAVGTPVPLISWRLNWGHVPPKCTWTSDRGIGVLVCLNMQPEDSGAYSCEAINNKGTTFAAPDAIVFVSKTDPCPRGYFNSEARSESECIRCFCFGKSNQCRSADLFTYHMPTPLGEGGTRLLGIKQSLTGDVTVDTQPITNQYYYQPLMNGATVTKLGYVSSWPTAHPYLTLPESYNGNQLRSYGGHIKYVVSPQTQVYGFDDNIASIIIKGKYGNLFHVSRVGGSREIKIQARLVPEDWVKSSPSGFAPASREDIMMTLDDIEMILLRADLNNAGVNITDFVMESADNINMELGAASLVEECTCPKEYKGESCQKCASGYVRKKVGPWLGDCMPEECPPGTYGDPSSGVPCKQCPCPLTNRENQFARTCSRGSDGRVQCDCFPGYEGKHCELCAPGYEGNPLIPGNKCTPVQVSKCNPVGTNFNRPPDECVCKDNVQGRYCDQCKNDSFYLSNDFRHGCALCFCSGVSQQCKSSSFRRKTISVQFNVPQIVEQVKIYNISPAGPPGTARYTAPVQSNLKPQLNSGDISLNEMDLSPSTIYYWSLPASFAGDKVTAYGGWLRYTLKNAISSSDSRFRNTAADVQLISDNQLTFHYFGNFSANYDGILNTSIQFLEKGWKRLDGNEISREHFLLALADVKTILIKASYSPNSQLASPVSASIDIAEPDGYGPTAFHVEQCVCPTGYVGTSCEDCAPGYTRSSNGLYLEHCEPCTCNGKSTMCNPETGVCYDCTGNTEGDQCERCKPGYDQDPYGNCVENPITVTPCSCDPRGTTRPCDGSGNCYCKQNVEGDSCDRCRPGTFGLDAGNPDGCLSCYCSGVTTDCHEGNHYTRIPLAAPVLGDDYGGFTITDLNGETVIRDDFLPSFRQSELLYVFPYNPTEQLYWSLPIFPGNRVLSYGGTLSLRQKFTSSEYEQSDRGTDVVLDGGDISIYWTNPNQFPSVVSYSYQVPLKEEGWYILNTATPATRSHFMSVLRNLKRVLVRATLAPVIEETTIADVSMDTATPSYDAILPAAKGIEICMCPPGYKGTSCEICEAGYYKDAVGDCQPCSCNGHDCQLDSRGQVFCNCQPPYTGYDCSAIGLVMELHPTIQDAGDDFFKRRVTFICKYRAPEPLTIQFYHEGRKQHHPKYYYESRLHSDGWHSTHIWHTMWDIRRQGEIYECHTITEGGFTLGVLTTTLPEPGGESSVTERPTRPPPPEPTIVVKISGPFIHIREVGGSVNFTCQAQSRNSRNRLPVKWSKSDGNLPLDRTQVDENVGLLLITNLQVSDSGKYICESSDGISTHQASTTLKVPGNVMMVPVVEIYPTVKDLYEGDRIELECRVRGNPTPTISWQRTSSKPLPLTVTYIDNRIIIESARQEDSGEYRCIAYNTVGSADRTAVVTVRQRPSWSPRDKLTVSVPSPSVDEGQSIRIACTGTANIPAGTIDWVRQDNAVFSSNVRSDNGVLFIDYAVPENRGVYICQAPSSPEVSPVPISLNVVERSPPPQNTNITVTVDRLKIPTGGSGTVDCNPVENPSVLIKWTKHGGSLGPDSSQRGNTLIINNAQDGDQGYYLCEGTINSNQVAHIYVFVEIEKREPPKLEIWPADEQAVPLGGEFVLTCRIIGGIPEPSAILWNTNTGRGLSSHTNMEARGVLRFTNIDVNDEGEYTCTASNEVGTASASTIIKVRSPPEITITPSNYVQVYTGDPINIECRANGYPEPMVSIELRDYGEVVPQSPRYAALHVTSASERDNGYYSCTASSAAGTITDQFVVIVSRRDDIDEGSGDIDIDTDTNTSPPYETPRDLYTTVGKPETYIDCRQSGANVKWVRLDSQPLQSNAYQDGSRLIILNATKSDSGQYVCNILDEYNEVREAVYTSLVVVAEPKITLRPPTQTVHPGQSPTVQCIVEGDDIIDIIWRPLTSVPSSRVDTRSPTLIFHQIEVEDAGRYECVARSRYATANAIAEVVVSEDTDLAGSVSHDNEQTAHVGAAVHLSCKLPPQNYRITWTKNGRPLPRSVRQKQDGSLFIRLAQKTDSGKYVCSVRDHYGSVITSNYINLHIQGRKCSDSEFHCYDYSGCVDEHLLCDGYRHCRDNSDEENCMWRDKRYLEATRKDYLTHDGPRDPNPESEQFVAIDQPRKQFRVGDNVAVLCKRKSRDVKLQWMRFGTNQYVASFTYGDGVMLSIQSVNNADAGVYRCVGTDVYGRTSYDDFNLEVQSGSGGPSYPDNSRDNVSLYNARLGSLVDMPCIHNLESPVVIEWRREFSPLPPEITSDQPILHLESVTEADAGTYVCRVSNSRAAVVARAILTVTGVVPRFDGDGFLALPTLKDAYKQFEIEISFKPTDQNGLILYNSENQGREGDYIGLQLKDGVPEFVINTGTEPLVVKGDRPLQLNTWHTIRLSRAKSKVTMDVDNTGPFIAESPEQWELLELKQPLYIGGVPDYDQLPAELSGASGFIGCASMLILGREEKNIIMDSYENNRVGECNSCSPNLCLNNGVCQEARNERGYICICASGYAGLNCDRTGEACRPGLCGPGKCADTTDGYKCACPVTHTGRNCEVKQSIEYPAFTGSAYIAIKAPAPSRTLRMSMKIKAASPVTDGIIMYCAESPRGYGGFTSLAVHDGRLEFRYDLGGGIQPVVLVSNRTLPANEWTNVHIARVGSVVSLKINSVRTFEQRLESPKQDLNLDTPIFVGGVDDSITLNSNTGVTGGFNGCIKDFMLHGEAIDIVNSTIQSANVQECNNYDRGDIPEMESVCQCRNGGTCTADPSTCACPPGFSGQLCEYRVPSSMRSSRQPPSDPCALRPCRNGGTCRPDLSSRMNHTCDCPLRYAGVYCQITLELFQSVGFNGNGYLELPASLLNYDNLDTDPGVIALAIHTAHDGVLLYQTEARGNPYYSDYILLRIDRGFVVFEWNLGGGKDSITVNVLVNDDERHQIIAKLLSDGRTSLSVDGTQREGTSSGISSVMNADSNIYVGGIPENLNQQAYPGFTGCIEQLELMNIDKGLNLGQVAVAGRNTQRCKEPSRYY